MEAAPSSRARMGLEDAAASTASSPTGHAGEQAQNPVTGLGEENAGVEEAVLLLGHMHPGLVAAVKDVQRSSHLGESCWIAYTDTKNWPRNPEIRTAEEIMEFLALVRAEEDVARSREEVHRLIKAKILSSTASSMVNMAETEQTDAGAGGTAQPAAASVAAQPVVLGPVDDIWCEIPHVVHLSGPDFHKLSDQVRAHLCHLQHVMHGWKVLFWSDDQCDSLINSICTENERSAYFVLNPKYGPARADFVRYVLMREYGGMWLDLKSGVDKEQFGKLPCRAGPLPPLVLAN